MSQVCSLTGAGRRMGANIAKAAPAAGNAVIATGRHTEIVVQPAKNWR